MVCCSIRVNSILEKLLTFNLQPARDISQWPNGEIICIDLRQYLAQYLTCAQTYKILVLENAGNIWPKNYLFKQPSPNININR